MEQYRQVGERDNNIQLAGHDALSKDLSFGPLGGIAF
jgi:hypothetical protein